MGIAAAFSVFLLKNLGFRSAPVFSCLCLVFILSELSVYFSDIIKIYTDFAPLAEGAEALLKIIGSSYLFGISSDVCRELGEGGIASALSLLGKLEVLALALPYIKELLSLATSLVGGGG